MILCEICDNSRINTSSATAQVRGTFNTSLHDVLIDSHIMLVPFVSLPIRFTQYAINVQPETEIFL